MARRPRPGDHVIAPPAAELKPTMDDLHTAATAKSPLLAPVALAIIARQRKKTKRASNKAAHNRKARAQYWWLVADEIIAETIQLHPGWPGIRVASHVKKRLDKMESTRRKDGLEPPKVPGKSRVYHRVSAIRKKVAATVW
jgi:hypothetical protein